MTPPKTAGGGHAGCGHEDVGREIEAAAEMVDLDEGRYGEICEAADIVASTVSPLSAFRSVVNNAIRTYGMVSVARLRADEVRIVANADIVKARFMADVERERETDRHREVVMYVDRKFQADCDRIASQERCELERIRSGERTAMQVIQKWVDVRYAEIAEDHARLIRDQEVMLLLHRRCMAEVEASRDGRMRLASQVTQSLLSESDRFSDSQFEMLKDMAVSYATADAMMRIDEFVAFQRELERRL